MEGEMKLMVHNFPVLLVLITKCYCHLTAKTPDSALHVFRPCPQFLLLHDLDFVLHKDENIYTERRKE